MDNWQRFRSSLEERFPIFVDALNEGASESELSAFEENVGASLPDSLKSIFQNSNGQNQKLNAYVFGMELLSLDGVKKAMAKEIELMEELKDEWDMCSSIPEGHIRQAYVNRKWIPIFHGGGGSYIGIDLDPAEKGVSGQVINFGIDDEDKFVLSESLELFLKQCAEKIESGKDVTYNDEYKMCFYTDLTFTSALAKEILEANV